MISRNAYIEAPIIGFVILVLILLTLGIYGFLRFSFLLFSKTSFYFALVVYLEKVLLLLVDFAVIKKAYGCNITDQKTSVTKS